MLVTLVEIALYVLQRLTRASWRYYSRLAYLIFFVTAVTLKDSASTLSSQQSPLRSVAQETEGKTL